MPPRRRRKLRRRGAWQVQQALVIFLRLGRLPVATMEIGEFVEPPANHFMVVVAPGKSRDGRLAFARGDRFDGALRWSYGGARIFVNASF